MKPNAEISPLLQHNPFSHNALNKILTTNTPAPQTQPKPPHQTTHTTPCLTLFNTRSRHPLSPSPFTIPFITIPFHHHNLGTTPYIVLSPHRTQSSTPTSNLAINAVLHSDSQCSHQRYTFTLTPNAVTSH